MEVGPRLLPDPLDDLELDVRGGRTVLNVEVDPVKAVVGLQAGDVGGESIGVRPERVQVDFRAIICKSHFCPDPR